MNFGLPSLVLFLIDDETLVSGNANRFAAWKIEQMGRVSGTMLPRMRYAKAPEGWRTPRRFAKFRGASSMRQLLECGSPLPLLMINFTGSEISPVLAAITTSPPVAGSGSGWQLVFVSLAVVILLMEIIHGWRLGLIRQLVRVIAIIVAYSCGFFAAKATIPIMRSYLKLPDPILAALGGAILAFVLFAAINLIGAFLFKKTAQQPSPVVRLIWGFSGAVLGILLGVFTLWLTFTGIRMIGSVAQAQLRTQNQPATSAQPNTTLRGDSAVPGPSRTGVSPPNPLMTMLAEMKASLENGRVGATVRAVDPLPPALYRGLEKAGEVASNPQSAERFLSFPGAREISEHPRVVALRNDRQVMELIATGQYFELMKNQHLIDAMNDSSLQARIKKFDLERALDYALQKNDSH
jgi:hypothetical protein